MTAARFTELVLARARRYPAVPEFLRYLACSAIALAVDAFLYGRGLHAGVGYELSAVAGFLAGLATAYGLSVRFAFSARSLRSPIAEFVIFAAIGVAGLALTETLLWVLIGMIHLPAMLAKVGAAGGVFMFNFFTRKIFLFSNQRKLRKAIA